MKKLVFILLACQLSGCVRELHVSPLPPPADFGRYSEIVVHRHPTMSYGARIFYIGVDGLAVAGLKSQEYVRLKVDPGPRRVWITCFDGITDSDFLQSAMRVRMGAFATPKPLGDWESDFMVLDVQEGSSYYIEAKPKLWTCAGIKRTEAMDLKEYVEIMPGEVSTRSFGRDFGDAMLHPTKVFKDLKDSFTPDSADKSGEKGAPP